MLPQLSLHFSWIYDIFFPGSRKNSSWIYKIFFLDPGRILPGFTRFFPGSLHFFANRHYTAIMPPLWHESLINWHFSKETTTQTSWMRGSVRNPMKLMKMMSVIHELAVYTAFEQKWCQVQQNQQKTNKINQYQQKINQTQPNSTKNKLSNMKAHKKASIQTNHAYDCFFACISLKPLKNKLF